MDAKLITDFEEFKTLEEPWDNLLNRAEPNILFLTHCWLSVWWESFAKADWEMLVILVYDNDRLIGAAPLVRKKEGYSKKNIEFFANSHTFRMDFLVDKEYARNTVLELIWKKLLETVSGWDLIKLKDLPSETGTAAQLQQILQTYGFSSSKEEKIESPFLPIDGTWEKYFSSRSKNHRKNMRRAVKKIDENGGMNLEVLTEIENVNRLMDEGLAIENSGWKGENESSILSNKEVTRFYKKLAEELNNRKWLNLFFLKLNGNNAAFDFCVRYKDRVYALKTGMDEKYAAFSPGQMLQMTELEYYFGQDVEEYDFIGPKMDFKMRWTDHLREHWTLYIYGKTFRGRVLKMINMTVLPRLRKSKFLQKLRS